jgi:hypothetical protein
MYIRKTALCFLAAAILIGFSFAGCKKSGDAGQSNAASNAAASNAAETNSSAVPAANASAEQAPAANAPAGNEAVLALCKKSAEAGVEHFRQTNAKMPEDALLKIAEQGEKGCLDAFNNLPEDQKAMQYNVAAQMLEKCKDKKGMDFMTCIGAK